MIAIAFALSYAGFLALCLSMPRHYRDVLRKNASDRALTALRIIGWLLLMAVFAVSVAEAGWQVGPVLWVALLTAGALPVSVLLTYAPRRLTAVACVLLPLSVVGAVVGV